MPCLDRGLGIVASNCIPFHEVSGVFGLHALVLMAAEEARAPSTWPAGRESHPKAVSAGVLYKGLGMTGPSAEVGGCQEWWSLLKELGKEVSCERERHQSLQLVHSDNNQRSFRYSLNRYFLFLPCAIYIVNFCDTLLLAVLAIEVI